MPKVSIIIAHHNGEDLLRRCLDTLFAQTFEDFEVLLVDNGSTDESVNMVRSRFPERMSILENDSNLGFAEANNQGMAAAKGELVLLLNNDTECSPSFLGDLVAAADNHPEYSSFACKVLIHSSRGYIDSTGLLLYLDGICRSRGWLEPDDGRFDEPVEVMAPCGCAALFRRSCLEDTGFFDPRYFAYLEDLDLGIRARLLGHRCLYVPTSPVYHVKSSTTGKHSREKAFFVERNRIWNALKLLPFSLLLASPFFTFLRYTCQGYAAMTYRGVSGNFTRDYSHHQLLGILFRAYGSALRELPAVLKERRRIQSTKRVKGWKCRGIFWRWRLPVLELALKD